MKTIIIIALILTGCSYPPPEHHGRTITGDDWLRDLESQGKVRRVLVTNESWRAVP